jgi:hypothetical protein
LRARSGLAGFLRPLRDLFRLRLARIAQRGDLLLRVVALLGEARDLIVLIRKKRG